MFTAKASSEIRLLTRIMEIELILVNIACQSPFDDIPDA